MNASITLLLLVISFALIGFAIWRDTVPREAGKIRYWSWKPVYMITLVIAIVLVVHLLNLFGIETGNRPRRF